MREHKRIMQVNKHKILVFGDKANGFDTTAVLNNKSYDVLRKASVHESLSAIIEHDIDLILVEDKNMERDAIKFCRIVKSHQRFNALPVIYLSHTFSKEFLVKAYEAGADDYIEQPFNRDELRDLIDLKLLIGDRKKQVSEHFRFNKQKLKLISKEIEILKSEMINQNNTTMKPDEDKIEMDVEKIKGKFLRIIVQELRSPVSAIIGFTDILKDGEANGDKGSLIDTLGDASRKSKELLDLALAITEIDPEKSTCKMRPYKVSSVLEYAIDDHSQLINDKRISITGPAESEITEVVIDPGLIKEVVRIFVFNAVWHTPKDGHIDISVNESIDKVELRIDDSGSGFNISDLNSISQFLKIPGVADRSEWPGLRFAIAKLIMDVHHAEIKIDNNTQGGATVKLIFPVNNAQREALHQLLSQLN